MPPRRAELVDRTLAWIVRHGVAGLSLRPLAKASGTSARLLIYHFGSKEGLLTAVMDEVRARLQASLPPSGAAGRRAAPDAADPLRAFWTWVTGREQLPLVGILLEVQVLALRQPAEYGAYLQRTSTSWLALVEAALPASPDRRTLATLCVAVVDGLTLELLATGDRRRTTDALHVFSTLLHGRRSRSAARRRGRSPR